MNNLKSERKNSKMKGISRSITKVTLAFVLMCLLSACSNSSIKETESMNQTLPEVGPKINLEILETTKEETTTAQEEITTTELESTKETLEEVIATTEEEISGESSTEAERFTFSDLDVHMYVQGSVNIRTLPSTEGDIAFVLHINDIVYVNGKCNETGWYRIDVEGQTFYVSNNYVSIEKFVQKASSPITPSSGFVYYTVAGKSPNKDYEMYLYNQLNSLGIAWWYPYAVAQIWQESRWNPSSTNGKDHGICQFKGIYFDGRAKHYAGLYNADIWNPYDSLTVYAHYMKYLLNACGNNIGSTLSAYFTGTGEWNQDYVDRVMNWYYSLQGT